MLTRFRQMGRTAAAALRVLASKGRPDVVFSTQNGLGDEILLTALAREWKKKHPKDRIWVIARQAEIFRDLSTVAHVLPPQEPTYSLLGVLCADHRHLEYQDYDPGQDRDRPVPLPFAAALMRGAGLSGRVAYQPELPVSASDRTGLPETQGAVVFQTTGRRPGGFMANKEWGEERFQELHRLVQSDFRTVQLGLKTDADLGATVDLRGRTSIRQAAAVLSEAGVFVGLASGLMHLARAVACPSVIVYGGREDPAISGYGVNANLTETPPCSPCWLRSRCDFGRVCLSEISVSRVLDAVKVQLQKDRPSGAEFVEL